MTLYFVSGALMTGVGSLIGLGNIVGGLFMLSRDPGSIVEIDRDSQRIIVRRWGLMDRSESVFSLDSWTGADIETGEHGEGGPIYRPRLRFSTSSPVLISLLWRQNRKQIEEIARQVEEFCRIRGA